MLVQYGLACMWPHYTMAQRVAEFTMVLPVVAHCLTTPYNKVMHAKPDLRGFLEWMIAGSGSVITDVIMPDLTR